MKQTQQILIALLTILLLASCTAQKRVWYLQDAQGYTPEQILQNGQIRIKPLDRLKVIVSSKNPELAMPFNAWSTYNSLSGQTGGAATGESSLQVRSVDADGMLEMPVIGRIECKGMTRNELSQAIAQKIIDGGYINDPSVNIEFADIKLSVIGEVARPGEFAITRDKITIFDALAMAGDLTVFGMRTNVAVAREVNGIRTITYMDLTSKEVFNSPAFYLQQNDVVYVKPNKYKAQSGEINQNRSFYLSLIGTAISVATLIVTLTR